MEKCNNCFWNEVSVETWPDFTTSEGVDKADKIAEIKNNTCSQCKQGSDKFKQISRCKKCNVRISMHNSMLHGDLCDDCFDAVVNSAPN